MKIQFAIPIKPHDELYDNIRSVFDSGILTDGENCREFELEFSKALGHQVFALSVSSCMAALHLSYLTLGIGPGDEVIVPAMTHVATAHAVELVGAIPIFVDCNDLNGNIDVEKIEENITRKTKAIGLVHYLGMPCKMAKIKSLCDAYDLHLIEDCALSLGAKYKGKFTGSFGDFGCFSFYPSKHITTGEGGMLVSYNKNLIDRAKSISRFGKEYVKDNRLYEVNKLGLNYRMSELSACLGRYQLTGLNQQLKQREENANYFYSSILALKNKNIITFSLSNNSCIVPENASRSAFYCFNINFEKEKRDYIRNELTKKEIQTSIMYPAPVPKLTYYKNKYGYQRILFPKAENISERTISFGIGPHITKPMIDYMVNCISDLI